MGPHSSVGALLAGRDDGLVRVQPLLDRAPRFADLLDTDPDHPAFAAPRRSELIGRPLGDAEFQDAIGRRLNRAVSPDKRGRKPRTDGRRVEEMGPRLRRSCRRVLFIKDARAGKRGSGFLIAKSFKDEIGHALGMDIISVQIAVNDCGKLVGCVTKQLWIIPQTFHHNTATPRGCGRKCSCYVLDFFLKSMAFCSL